MRWWSLAKVINAVGPSVRGLVVYWVPNTLFFRVTCSLDVQWSGACRFVVFRGYIFRLFRCDVMVCFCDLDVLSYIGASRIFLGGGGLPGRVAVCGFCLILKTVLWKWCQNLLADIQLGYRGKLKPSGKEKIYRFLSFCYIFQYCSVLVVRRFSDWVRQKRKSCKTFISSGIQSLCFLNFCRGGGGSSQLEPPPPPQP
jgi:hypothetical protein